jgi:trehalose/maltose transport system permease protein
MLATQETERSYISQLEINLISLLFLILGIAPFLFLLTSVPTDPTIIEAARSDKSVILAFLDTFGIILPLVIIGAGVFALRLAFGLYRRDINAAAWAQLLLMWLCLIMVIPLIQTIAGGLGIRQVASNWVLVVVGIVLVEVIFVGALLWLRSNESYFEGQEDLFARDTRTAWNLLIPTMAVLIIIAARPLEQTFIASLTDRRFAGVDEINFVGLNNYARLLGIRLDAIPCVQDDSGNCVVETDRQGVERVVYPRPRDYLGDDYRDLRYRQVGEYNILGNYLVLSARDGDFINAVGNTLYFTFFSVTLELILGLFIALVVNSKFPGRGLLRTAMLVPWAIPTVVSARLWETMLRDNQSGIINSVMLGTGMIDTAQAWLASPALQLPALIAVDVWKTTPFMALILLAGLQVIPSDIYEAADVDGANRVRQFFTLTLPLLRPTIAVALVFRTVDALRAFDVFQVLLGRQKLSMATYNYEMLVSNQQFGYASAVGVVIFILILVFTVVYVRALGVTSE